MYHHFLGADATENCRFDVITKEKIMFESDGSVDISFFQK